MISKALEEYLKTIYVLQVKTNEIRVTDIANQMQCSKPSVNKAINNLKENGLLNYETYGKIELTKSGEDLAEKIKSTMEDNTINKLAKYVHKVLNLNDLNCNYDIAQERCRKCIRRKKFEQ